MTEATSPALLILINNGYGKKVSCSFIYLVCCTFYLNFLIAVLNKKLQLLKYVKVDTN